MIAGMIPTAISLTGDNSWRAPMGITVIGGLALSTVLTLLIVPATFSLAVGVERWIGPKLGRRLLTYRPGDDEPAAIDHHRSEEHTSELQSLMRISYAVFCLKKKKYNIRPLIIYDTD